VVALALAVGACAMASAIVRARLNDERAIVPCETRIADTGTVEARAVARAIAWATGAHLGAVCSGKTELAVAPKGRSARLRFDGRLADAVACAIVEASTAHDRAVIAGEADVAAARPEAASPVTRAIARAVRQGGHNATIIARVALLAEAFAAGEALAVSGAVAIAASTDDGAIIASVAEVARALGV